MQSLDSYEIIIAPKGAGELVVRFPVDEAQHRRIRVVSKVKLGTLRVDQATKKIDVKAFDRDFLACWDTGAMNTVVVPTVVNTANLIRRGTTDSVGIDGIVKKRPTYHAAVVLPCGPSALVQLGTEMTAVESDSQLDGIEMLIGMDIIKRGRTLIERDAAGQLWFEFRPPQPDDDKPENSTQTQGKRKQTHGSRALHRTKKTSGKRRRR